MKCNKCNLVFPEWTATRATRPRSPTTTTTSACRCTSTRAPRCAPTASARRRLTGNWTIIEQQENNYAKLSYGRYDPTAVKEDVNCRNLWAWLFEFFIRFRNGILSKMRLIGRYLQILNEEVKSVPALRIFFPPHLVHIVMLRVL